MRRSRRRVFAIAILILFFTFCCVLRWTTQAANGRDFAGFYALSDASPSGSGYTLTFTTRVFNYSGADVIDAQLSLRGCAPPTSACADFEHINIDSTRSVRLSAQVSVPGTLYDRWLKGWRPELIVQFTNVKGERQAERIDLGPDHTGIRTREE